jgi:hypothetical protein
MHMMQVEEFSQVKVALFWMEKSKKKKVGIGVHYVIITTNKILKPTKTSN